MEGIAGKGPFGALEDYRIEGLPAEGYYIKDFITPDEEEELLHKVRNILQSPVSILRVKLL